MVLPPVLLFVNSTTLGNQPCHTHQIRSHVRRRNLAVIQHNRVQQGENFVTNGDAAKKRARKLPKSHGKSHRELRAKPVETSPISTVECPTTEQTSRIEHDRQIKNCASWTKALQNSRPIPLDPSHPYTSYISNRVKLPENVVDLLFKSHSFQIVTEPLFCSNHVDNDTNIVSVFPGCFDNTAFAYALLHSIMLGIDTPFAEHKSLHLKSLAVKHLHQDLESLDKVSLDIVIGTILILCGAAYRTNLLMEHNTHSAGLLKLLEYGKSQNRQLRVATKRVMFWQDLIGAACIGSRRSFSHLSFPEVSSIVDPVTTPIRELPQGFTRHQDVLINDLQVCIKDVVSLQMLYESGDKETRNFTVLDKWQASIESRLVFLTDSCFDFGVISECCRLATYICCYSVYTDVWKNSFIPLKQAERLMKHLSESLDHSVWSSRRDIFLWLLFVCTSVVQDAKGSSRLIRKQHDYLIKQILVSTNGWVSGDLYMKRALEEFMYVSGWLQRRYSNNQWLTLELALKHAAQA